jgi:hypothetical protein
LEGSAQNLLRTGILAFGLSCLGSTAHALVGPTNIQVDGGPLGAIEISGGIDGFVFAQAGATPPAHDDGGVIDDMLIEVQKTSGPVQFDVQITDYHGYALGVGTPEEAAADEVPTSPILIANIIFVVNKNLSISIGQLYSIEGYESNYTWGNTSGAASLLYYLGNGASHGIAVTYTRGAASLELLYGDGNDTSVYNNLQYLAAYNFDSNNNLSIFGSVALAQTGPNANYYSGYKVGGNEIFINGNVIGGFYSRTTGNLTLTPELFYEYAPANVHYQIPADNVPKQTASFGIATFGQYNFPHSPYSIGGWIDYASSQGSSALDDDWILGPGFKAAGFSIAPAWQNKDVYLRITAGYNRLLQVEDGFGYGSSGRGKNFYLTMLEAGLVF